MLSILSYVCLFINDILAIEIFGLIISYLLEKEFHITLWLRFVPEVDSDLKMEYNVESTRALDEEIESIEGLTVNR